MPAAGTGDAGGRGTKGLINRGCLGFPMRRLATVAVLLVALVLAAQPALAQDPIQVLEIDTYERTLATSDPTTFNWTVRNIDVVMYNVSVEASPIPGWTISVSPTLISNLAPNRAAPVRVDVAAPASVAAEILVTLQVVFTVRLDGAVVFIATKTAMLHIPSIYAEKRVLGVFANPLPAPLDNEWGVFLLDVLAWLGISIAVLLVVIPVVRRLGAMTKTRVADVVLRIVRTPLLILLFLYGMIQSLDALDRHVTPSIRETLATVYQIALTFIVFYLTYRVFKDVVVYLARTVSQKTATHIDDILVPIVEKVGLVVLGIVAVATLLGYLRVDLTLFIAGGVVTSMVIAFAAQDTLSNFFSGIFLLTDRPFKVGDIVILPDGDWAEVRAIGMRTTRLFRFSDASLVTIPNNKLVNEKIANFSNPMDKGRVMMTFGVGYGSDIMKVKRIIREVIAGNPHIIQEAPTKPIVRFDAMAESALNFFVLVWIDDRRNRFDVIDYLNTELYTRFTEEGVEIPFPQRTVHVRFEDRGSAPVDLQEILRERGHRPDTQAAVRERSGDRHEEA